MLFVGRRRRSRTTMATTIHSWWSFGTLGFVPRGMWCGAEWPNHLSTRLPGSSIPPPVSLQGWGSKQNKSALGRFILGCDIRHLCREPFQSAGFSIVYQTNNVATSDRPTLCMMETSTILQLHWWIEVRERSRSSLLDPETSSVHIFQRCDTAKTSWLGGCWYRWSTLAVYPRGTRISCRL